MEILWVLSRHTLAHGYSIALLVQSIANFLEITFALRVILNGCGFHEKGIMSASFDPVNALLIGFC